MTMKEFTADDWTGYAGCESWPHSEPLIGEEGDLLVVADASGISAYLTAQDRDGDNMEPDCWHLPLKVTPDLATLISNTVLAAQENGILKAMLNGFGFMDMNPKPDYAGEFLAMAARSAARRQAAADQAAADEGPFGRNE